MKKYYLSTPSERTAGIAFSFLVSIALVFLLFKIRSNLTIFLLAAVGVVLIIGILAMYAINAAKAACMIDEQNQILRITGFPERKIPLSKIACLETIKVKTGQVESRSLAFTDAEGGVVAIVPTYFTSNRGVLAEPMAMELAKAMNITFKSNVPAWEYDDEARKAHEIEVQEQEKEESRKRREAKKALREAKIRKKMADLKNEE